MLKVDDKCKAAIDAFYQGLEDLNKLQMLPGEKAKAGSLF